ncbi:hypothetical protein RJ640_001457 [Escallonia rubra]|uniref:Ubiquitin-like protease family profile domain-containing protein n=1 Tax=Escallonia rubra TaxID=112253 RepID=A0AA88S1R0_9ASTE|nr:hypothetical protein RJ640_001457 [Escallonia rubra]
MGALTSNRKRGDDSYTSNLKYPSLYSRDITTHIAKKPRISQPLQPSTGRLISSNSAVSKYSRYPVPKSQLRREVLGPVRTSRFGLAGSSRVSFGGDKRESFGFEVDSGLSLSGNKSEAMGNALWTNYDEKRRDAIDSFMFLGKKKEREEVVEAIDVKDDVLEDDSGFEILEDGHKWRPHRIVETDGNVEIVENGPDRRLGQTNKEVEVVEDQHEWQSHQVGETNGNVVDLMELDGKVAEGNNFQPSTSSVVSGLTNVNLKVERAEKMLDSLSLYGEVDNLEEPLHRRLLDSARRHNDKLNGLQSQIKVKEALLASLRLLRPAKKPHEDATVREPFVPLTKEEEAEVSRALNSNRRKILVTHENSNIEITGQVLQCLRPGAWLNDEVINLYFELLKEREKREPQKFLKCHFFNTFFYKKLVSGRSGYDFKSVGRWTTQRKLGYCLLECDKIFVPIHKEVHWCLAVINKKDEKFQYLDSLGGQDKQVMRMLLGKVTNRI